MAMALPNEGAARSPVKTYEDLRATIADSGRVYGIERKLIANDRAEHAINALITLPGHRESVPPVADAILVMVRCV